MLTSWQVWATQNNNGNNWMFVAYNGYDNSENVTSQTEGRPKRVSGGASVISPSS